MSTHAHPLTQHATVDSLADDRAVLDVDGTLLTVPRAWLPGDVSEGTGFSITIAPAPEHAKAVADSVAARLKALTGK